MHYDEIYTVCQAIGERIFTLNGTKRNTTAAELAVMTLSGDINSCYSKESADGQQAWEVIVKDVLQDIGTIAILTEEEIIQTLTSGKIIKYCDITSNICMVWIGTLRVFN